jgi:hypothetical protein
MTEQEWLACGDPQPMLEQLRGKASDRKLRLFACGCCRYFWEMLNENSRNPIEVVEDFSDGRRPEEEWLEVRAGAWDATHDVEGTSLAAAEAAAIAVGWNGRLSTRLRPVEWQAAWPDFRDAMIAADGSCYPLVPIQMLRDIFGNPFRLVTLNPSWQTSNVTALATAIYDDRAFDRLPILADALEDAGCDNADILNHCRQPGIHVRGCWVVDLVLQKA